MNLANDPRYASRRKKMEQLLLAEMRRLNAPYRFLDQSDDELVPRAGKAHLNSQHKKMRKKPQAQGKR